jgi:hypothetical protein
MPVRYDQDTKAKAIRLVREYAGDYPSEYAAITAVARRLGMSPETDLPRAFRTADLWLIHAADCFSRYSSWTCCGVRY